MQRYYDFESRDPDASSDDPDCDTCDPAAFPVGLDDVQCKGLGNREGVADADACRAACCADAACNGEQEMCLCPVAQKVSSFARFSIFTPSATNHD